MKGNTNHQVQTNKIIQNQALDAKMKVMVMFFIWLFYFKLSSVCRQRREKVNRENPAARRSIRGGNLKLSENQSSQLTFKLMKQQPNQRKRTPDVQTLRRRDQKIEEALDIVRHIMTSKDDNEKEANSNLEGQSSQVHDLYQDYQPSKQPPAENLNFYPPVSAPQPEPVAKTRPYHYRIHSENLKNRANQMKGMRRSSTEPKLKTVKTKKSYRKSYEEKVAETEERIRENLRASLNKYQF